MPSQCYVDSSSTHLLIPKRKREERKELAIERKKERKVELDVLQLIEFVSCAVLSKHESCQDQTHLCLHIVQRSVFER